MSESPSTTASNGQRGPHGRFSPGNKLARGNPHAKRVARLRSTLLKAVTTDDIRAIVARLLQDALAGNVQAAKEILERTLGKAQETDLIERIDKLEAILAEGTRK